LAYAAFASSSWAFERQRREERHSRGAGLARARMNEKIEQELSAPRSSRDGARVRISYGKVAFVFPDKLRNTGMARNCGKISAAKPFLTRPIRRWLFHLENVF